MQTLKLIMTVRLVAHRYTLMTPMIASDGRHAVLVNRGWVPAEWKTDPKVQSLNTPAAEVDILRSQIKIQC